MENKNERILTRREFAQRAAILSATVPLATAGAALPADLKDVSPQPASTQVRDTGQAEANSRYQQIMDLYANRFDDGQKAELKRMCAETQPSLDRIRGYALQNGDAPALYLKPLVEREKKAQPPTSSAAKKP